MPNKTITIDQLVKQHDGNIREAAAAVAVDYFTFWRWHRRKVYAPKNSATRHEMIGKGVELPLRPRRKP